MADLEAQQRCPSWISKVEQALQSNQDHVPKNQEFYISKIPEFFRQPPAEFTPREWRFGLHNREKLNTSGSEAMKLAIASALGLVGQKWKDFCENVVSDECLLDIKHCYGLREEETSLTDEVIKYMLALDALLLVAYMEWKLLPEDHLVWTEEHVAEKPFPILPKAGFPIWSILRVDLCKIENQVPFSLIINVVSCVTGGQAATLESYMRKLIRKGAMEGVCPFMDVSGGFFKTPGSLNPASSDWKTHFLATAYELICGDEGLKRRSDYSTGEYLHIPSASQLRSSGIAIKGVAGPLELLSYEDACLCLPKMEMTDETMGVARNIAWYEYTQKGHCMFLDYIFLMEDLIQTHMDFDILVDCGVFSKCGVPAATAVAPWRQIGQGLLRRFSSKQHHDMKYNIVKRCKLRRYRLWDAFQIEFCSKPWVLISVFTVALVSAATLIQTYVAVIGSNRMKPHFP